MSDKVLLDSREGMERLAQWARAGGFVLNLYHEKLAARHGVSLEGIAISRPLPVDAPKPI